jgi:hypothetical protein
VRHHARADHDDVRAGRVAHVVTVRGRCCESVSAVFRALDSTAAGAPRRAGFFLGHGGSFSMDELLLPKRYERGVSPPGGLRFPRANVSLTVVVPML